MASRRRLQNTGDLVSAMMAEADDPRTSTSTASPPPAWLTGSRRRPASAVAVTGTTGTAALAAGGALYLGPGPLVAPAASSASSPAKEGPPARSPAKAATPMADARPKSASPTKPRTGASSAALGSPLAKSALPPAAQAAHAATVGAFEAAADKMAAGLGAPATLSAWWGRLDSNGNGKVSLAEFDKWLREAWPALRLPPAVAQAYKHTLGGGGGAKAAPADGYAVRGFHSSPSRPPTLFLTTADAGGRGSAPRTLRRCSGTCCALAGCGWRLRVSTRTGTAG